MDTCRKLSYQSQLIVPFPTLDKSSSVSLSIERSLNDELEYFCCRKCNIEYRKK